MTAQDIFNALAEIESNLFYASIRSESEEIKEAHNHIKKALVLFAKATGYHN